MGTRVLTALEPLWRGLPSVDPLPGSSSVSCPLQPRYESVRGARQFTRETLSRWELDDLFDGVALVVSELVTNALRHAVLTPDEAVAAAAAPNAGAGLGVGLVPAPGPASVPDPSSAPGPSSTPGPASPPSGSALDEADPAQLHLMRWSSRLICAVRDSSDASPVSGEADEGAESGRGLHLVESFSDSWGWHPLAGAPHGKIVWALFRVP
ncbi:ATP-binding protein [Streptomyces sp. NPDC003077]|uniref:ATP-binding protein n=1 Tax=Streptomyces sp. NPDC003077 TaxID=3154443 RepID=UPI0033A47544